MAMKQESGSPERIMTVTNQLPNIHQRIQAVKKKVSYVRKTGEIAQGREKYRVVTHDEVTGVLHEALVEAGINLEINILPDTIKETQSGTSAAGTPRMRFYAHFKVQAVNVDTPDNRLSMLVVVHADDYGDKGPGKAISMAMKIFKLKVFDLETGENEEERVEDAGGNSSRKVTVAEATKLRKLIEVSPTNEQAFVQYLQQDPTMKNLESLDGLYFGVWEWAMNYIQGIINEHNQGQGEHPNGK